MLAVIPPYRRPWEDDAMTQTLDSPPLTPQQRAETWLSGLEDALRSRLPILA